MQLIGLEKNQLATITSDTSYELHTSPSSIELTLNRLHAEMISVGPITSVDVNRSQTTRRVACPSSQYHGYESQFGLRLTAGVGQFSASGAHAKEAENGRANSTGVWSPSELCGRR